MSAVEEIFCATKKLCDMLCQTKNLVEAIRFYLIDRTDRDQDTIACYVNTLLDKLYVSDLLEITIMILLVENNLSEVHCYELEQHLFNATWWIKTNNAKNSLELLSRAYTDIADEF